MQKSKKGFQKKDVQKKEVNMPKSKKGLTLGDGFPMILALILVALLVIIAIYIFVTLQLSSPAVSMTTINETGWINATPYYLQNFSLCDANSPIVVYTLNRTDASTITSGNYTLTVGASNWFITNTSRPYNNVSITYSQTWGAGACTAASATIAQFATFPALIGLVGTIIFLALLIGVLIGSFAYGGKKGV